MKGDIALLSLLTIPLACSLIVDLGVPKTYAGMDGGDGGGSDGGDGGDGGALSSAGAIADGPPGLNDGALEDEDAVVGERN